MSSLNISPSSIAQMSKPPHMTSPASLSPPSSLPRPPRCLTPYPFKIQNSPPARSPLSSPETTPELEVDDPFNSLQTTLRSCSLERSVVSLEGRGPMLSSTEEGCKRSIPIELRMSSLSPTDSSFPNDQLLVLSPSPRGASYRIPLSPSAKRYMQDKENKKRPVPILIPHRPARDNVRIRGMKTARPYFAPSPRDKRTALRSEIGSGGSVPLPRTPIPTPGRTAIPLTARRVGISSTTCNHGAFLASPTPDTGEQSVLISEDEIEVPVLRRQPSPGWAEL